MTDWMASQRFDSAPLRWYVNYACRDDYGASLADVSAWSGLFYFAARKKDVGLAVVAITERRLPFSTGEVVNVDGGFHLRRL